MWYLNPIKLSADAAQLAYTPLSRNGERAHKIILIVEIKYETTGKRME